MNVPIIIVGCTASGKSDLAEALAEHLGATVMAVDSMQVYRGMDIGTAKPDAATRARIPHIMIDVADPWESYSAARFVAEAWPLLDLHLKNQRPLILVAGTILYLRALTEGLFEGPSADAQIRGKLEAEAARLAPAAVTDEGDARMIAGAPGLHARLTQIDPPAAARIHPNDLRRIVRALEVHQLTGQRISDLQTQWNLEHPAIPGIYLGVERPREVISRRINTRVRAMMAAPEGAGGGGGGLLAEVRRLAEAPQGLSREAASGVGYRQLLDHLEGRLPLDEAIEQIKIRTRHLAKLQRTWLKRFAGVHWLSAEESQSGRDLLPRALDVLANATKSVKETP
jgi:tRNA dimethylallyltransferase